MKLKELGPFWENVCKVKKYFSENHSLGGGHSVPRGGKNYFWVCAVNTNGGLFQEYRIFLGICKKNQIKSSIFEYFMAVQSLTLQTVFVNVTKGYGVSQFPFKISPIFEQLRQDTIIRPGIVLGLIIWGY